MRKNETRISECTLEEVALYSLYSYVRLILLVFRIAQDYLKKHLIFQFDEIRYIRYITYIILLHVH